MRRREGEGVVFDNRESGVQEAKVAGLSGRGSAGEGGLRVLARFRKSRFDLVGLQELTDGLLEDVTRSEGD